MRPRLVIFDCDGVLVDSEPIASKILSTALKAHGFALSPAETDERFRGRSLSDCLQIVESELGHSLPENFLAELNRHTFQAFRGKLRAIPGVEGAIQKIRHQGLAICVASSGSHEKIELTLSLTGLLPYFESSRFSASEVQKGKPSPDLFLLAAQKMGVSPEECCVVEDSFPGAAAGIRAGAQVLAFLPPPQDAPAHVASFEGLGAKTFGRMEELPGLLSLSS